MDGSMFRREIRIDGHDGGGTGFSGGAVILCALAALCVVVLNLMAATRAEASMRLARAAADETAGYYGACLEANRDIADLRASGKDWALEKTYRISDAQELTVRAGASGGAVTVYEWRSVPSGTWSGDQRLDVAK